MAFGDLLKSRIRYSQCQNPECRFPKCQNPEFHFPECQNPEFRFPECQNLKRCFSVAAFKNFLYIFSKQKDKKILKHPVLSNLETIVSKFDNTGCFRVFCVPIFSTKKKTKNSETPCIIEFGDKRHKKSRGWTFMGTAGYRFSWNQYLGCRHLGFWTVIGFLARKKSSKENF